MIILKFFEKIKALGNNQATRHQYDKSDAMHRLARNSQSEFLRPSNEKDKASHSSLCAGLLILDIYGESQSK